MIEKHGNIEIDGFDYYIEDDLGGIHTDGVGYAPDGHFCGECIRESCEGCWTEENVMWDRKEDQLREMDEKKYDGMDRV